MDDNMEKANYLVGFFVILIFSFPQHVRHNDRRDNNND